MVTSPRRSSSVLVGLGLLLGVVGGWVGGLLRAPRQATPRQVNRAR